MKFDHIWREKLACAYFFILPALAYGILTSRLPSLKIEMTASDGDMGGLLLALGVSTLAGLLAADMFIEYFSARAVAAFSGVCLMIFISCAGYAASYRQMLIFLLFTGLSVGLCDVAMNAVGIFMEQKNDIHCLAFLHACSSIGGAFGAFTGFIFASLEFSPFLNLAVILGLYLLIWPFAFILTPQDQAMSTRAGGKPRWKKIPLFLYFCGVMSLACHIVEGSVGEWGSILLSGHKGAGQGTAALVFACFTGAMVVSRLFTDNIRYKISDSRLVSFGSAGGFLGMALALLSPWPCLCLAGYAVMGFSVAPITPILFSRGGKIASVTPGQASAVVSVFSYAGLLFFPPFLGMLADDWGLVKALWLVALLCLLMLPGGKKL